MEPTIGLEPMTCRLRIGCSTTELRRLFDLRTFYIPSYIPSGYGHRHVNVSNRSWCPTNCSRSKPRQCPTQRPKPSRSAQSVPVRLGREEHRTCCADRGATQP